jgi:hypothetical protein
MSARKTPPQCVRKLVQRSKSGAGHSHALCQLHPIEIRTTDLEHSQAPEPYSEAELREKGKAYVWGTPSRYDPMPTLRAVKALRLWILGEDDLEAPPPRPQVG